MGRSLYSGNGSRALFITESCQGIMYKDKTIVWKEYRLRERSPLLIPSVFAQAQVWQRARNVSLRIFPFNSRINTHCSFNQLFYPARVIVQFTHPISACYAAFHSTLAIGGDPRVHFDARYIFSTGKTEGNQRYLGDSGPPAGHIPSTEFAARLAV